MFRIEHSTNRNAVYYDLNLTASGTIHKTDPLSVYWLMHETDGRHQELTTLERQVAYGYDLMAPACEDVVYFSLRALPTRPIVARKRSLAFHADTQISGIDSKLVRVFVTRDRNSRLGKVHYADLFGRAILDGRATTERVRA